MAKPYLTVSDMLRLGRLLRSGEMETSLTPPAPYH